MALNPNHAFEDLGDVKCSVVEKNCSPERVDFLKKLLEFNGYTVIVVKSPPPKAAKPAPKPAGDAEPAVAVPEAPLPPDTFTVGVTDVTFNPINAVFNRDLNTPDGKVVTSDYWKQRTPVSKEDEWYWSR